MFQRYSSDSISESGYVGSSCAEDEEREAQHDNFLRICEDVEAEIRRPGDLERQVSPEHLKVHAVAKHINFLKDFHRTKEGRAPALELKSSSGQEFVSNHLYYCYTYSTVMLS